MGTTIILLPSCSYILCNMNPNSLLLLYRFIVTVIHIIDNVRFPELRLAGGPTGCQGRLEVAGSSGRYIRACNVIIGTSEAQVICRQLGCQAEGAKRSLNPEV